MQVAGAAEVKRARVGDRAAIDRAVCSAGDAEHTGRAYGQRRGDDNLIRIQFAVQLRRAGGNKGGVRHVERAGGGDGAAVEIHAVVKIDRAGSRTAQRATRDKCGARDSRRVGGIEIYRAAIQRKRSVHGRRTVKVNGGAGYRYVLIRGKCTIDGRVGRAHEIVDRLCVTQRGGSTSLQV